MFGFAVRFLGYAALAMAMVVGVLDGARGIADGVARLSSLAAVLEGLFPRTYPSFGGAIGRLMHPMVWDPVMTTLLRAPATPALFAIGLGLLLASRPRQEAILPRQ